MSINRSIYTGGDFKLLTESKPISIEDPEFSC